MGDDKGGTLDLLDNPGHGEGLAGPGHAEQRLMFQTPGQPVRQLFDGFGLVSGRPIICSYFEWWHLGVQVGGSPILA